MQFNFIVSRFDGGSLGLGAGFASFAAIIPLFASHLTPSALLIGLVPAIHNVGWQLPQWDWQMRQVSVQRYHLRRL